MNKLLRLGWFTTANGEGSYGLLFDTLEAIKSKKLIAKIEFVFVNRDFGQSDKTDDLINLVKKNNIPLVTLSSRKFRKNRKNKPWEELREIYDIEVIEKLKKFNIDIAIHAGYMLIAPVLCSYFKTINLHPALPGETIGIWQKAIWDVILLEKSHTGAMIHLSTVNVDEGPVISYCEFSVKNNNYSELWEEKKLYKNETILSDIGEKLPLFQKIRSESLLRERPLMIETLKAIQMGKISIENIEKPINLTSLVEEYLYRI